MDRIFVGDNSLSPNEGFLSKELFINGFPGAFELLRTGAYSSVSGLG
jgi:hypothetical protein